MKNILIYTTPTCVYCKKTKDYLQQHNVPFTQIDVSLDPIKAQEMIDKSGQIGVPVLDIDGTIIVGFDPEKISAALHLA